jgi:hypothetical protein
MSEPLIHSAPRALKTGVEENLPYSFSRWTDVPAAKWSWFRDRLAEGSFAGIDPRSGVPAHWSLSPEDTLGLTFWTKDPRNLLRDHRLLREYDKVEVHVTVTGWEEVEKGAPDLDEACDMLVGTSCTFPRTHWRFSPVPLLPHEEVIGRFVRILDKIRGSRIRDVYLSFLQSNDLMVETRDREARLALMGELAARAQVHGMRVLLCNEDRTLYRVDGLPSNLRPGVCAPARAFGLPGHEAPPSEGCGCVLMVDPFTINESCTLGCTYCLDPATPVLFEDFSWRPLATVRPGDRLIGFDEEPEGPRKIRKFRSSKVEGVWTFHKPVLRVVTESTEFYTTEDHLWLEGRTRKQWKRADRLSVSSVLHRFDVALGPDFLDDYKLGFFGRSIDFAHDRIVSIERAGEREVIDIRTSTRTFMAAGLATHNCYAADRTLAPKKRNTTKGLPLLP